MPAEQRLSSAFSIWLWAFRPRTLPLAAAAIILGCGLAASRGAGNLPVFLLALFTAVTLQVLSNLANDYGDAVHGADDEGRKGPLRIMVAGLVTRRDMLVAIWLAAALALVSGTILVGVAADGDGGRFVLFFLLGILCIVAAVCYTMGKHPYGYVGLGDVMAGLFFGPIAVIGSAVLCGASPDMLLCLPGLSTGFCTTAVLNINNMRDIHTDARTGKMTVAVRLGLQKSRWYHATLVLLAMALWAVFCLSTQPRLLLCLAPASIPLLASTCRAVRHAEDTVCLDRQLRGTAIGTAVLNVGMAVACLCLA